MSTAGLICCAEVIFSSIIIFKVFWSIFIFDLSSFLTFSLNWLIIWSEKSDLSLFSVYSFITSEINAFFSGLRFLSISLLLHPLCNHSNPPEKPSNPKTKFKTHLTIFDWFKLSKRSKPKLCKVLSIPPNLSIESSNLSLITSVFWKNPSAIPTTHKSFFTVFGLESTIWIDQTLALITSNPCCNTCSWLWGSTFCFCKSLSPNVLIFTILRSKFSCSQIGFFITFS